MLRLQVLLCAEDVVPQDALVHQCEVLRVPRTDKLQDHLHEFFARQFGTGECVEDSFAVLGVQFFPLHNAALVCAFELDPPVGFQLR